MSIKKNMLMLKKTSYRLFIVVFLTKQKVD